MANGPISVAEARRGSHLIWTGCGHWLPNDPRGSGSAAVRSGSLKEFGPVHHGRNAVQPSRQELRTFLKDAGPKMLHPVIWFEDKVRQAIGNTFSESADAAGYTVWALAVMRNHVHAVIRTHRDRSDTMLLRLATAMREAVWASGNVPYRHPVWSARMYKVYLANDEAVRRTIQYVQQNPLKDGLPPQHWPGVTAFSPQAKAQATRPPVQRMDSLAPSPQQPGIDQP